jgi:methylase of polypeptide subunit release factors
MSKAVAYRTESYRDLDVCWLPDLDGGGRAFGQDYLDIVRSLFGRVGRVFEFCAGPGFIGFSLLAHGLCDSLTVADVNPRAVDALRETVRRNSLGDLVTVHQSDGLRAIPENECWDLVVGNPPHFSEPLHTSSRRLITDDLGWRLHESFYRDVGRFLSDGGSVLLQENSKGSSPADFLPMLRARRSGPHCDALAPGKWSVLVSTIRGSRSWPAG